MLRPLENSPRPRRVLHLRTVTGPGGGPEKTLLNTHRFLPAEYQSRLLYLYPRNDARFDLIARARAAGAELIAVPEFGPCDPRAIAQLYREVRSYRPDVLHAHDYKTEVLAASLGKCLNIPAVTTLHGNVTLGGRLTAYYKIGAWAWRRMARVMAVSPDLVELAVTAGVPRERCRLIENGIDFDSSIRRLSPAEARRNAGLDAAGILLAAVGRLMPEKGFDVLLAAFASALKDVPSLRLVIAGEGPERARLERLINELKLTEHAVLLGHRSDVGVILQAAEIFVLSSRREAFPNVVLEAMAMETSVIATRVAGVPGIIDHARTGLLVDSENVTQLAFQMKRLAQDDRLRSLLAAAARSEVEKRFSFADRMQKECAVYDEILSAQAGNE
ncbi:MAG: glycosyltransferase [Planctomycetaceae bacterium]|nr:glycosyltransferase [Planctomycetaceae bacterium]